MGQRPEFSLALSRRRERRLIFDVRVWTMAEGGDFSDESAASSIGEEDRSSDGDLSGLDSDAFVWSER